MSEIAVWELKTLVPAKDFELSKRFYEDLGFTLEWTAKDGSLAHFCLGRAAFLLRNHSMGGAAENMMMHLLVPDVESWYRRIRTRNISQRYSVRVVPPALQEWGVRDMTLRDPSGVLWCIGQATGP